MAPAPGHRHTVGTKASFNLRSGRALWSSVREKGRNKKRACSTASNATHIFASIAAAFITFLLCYLVSVYRRRAINPVILQSFNPGGAMFVPRPSHRLSSLCVVIRFLRVIHLYSWRYLQPRRSCWLHKCDVVQHFEHVLLTFLS